MLYRIFFLLPMLLTSFVLTAMEWNMQEERNKDEVVIKEKYTSETKSHPVSSETMQKELGAQLRAMEKNDADQIKSKKHLTYNKGWADEVKLITQVNNVYKKFNIKISKRVDPKIAMGIKMLYITDEQQKTKQLEAFQSQFSDEFKNYPLLSQVLKDLAGQLKY